MLNDWLEFKDTGKWFGVIEVKPEIVCKNNIPVAEIKPIAALPNKKRPVGPGRERVPGFSNRGCL